MIGSWESSASLGDYCSVSEQLKRLVKIMPTAETSPSSDLELTLRGVLAFLLVEELLLLLEESSSDSSAIPARAAFPSFCFDAFAEGETWKVEVFLRGC